MLKNKMTVITDGGYAKIVYTLSENEKIDKFANGMLVNNSIKGIMPYSVANEKGTVRLIYSMNTGIRLSVMIKQNISKNNMLSVYRGVAEVLLAAEEYMLDIDGFILDADHVFVDTNTLDVYMIYVPTNQRCNMSLNSLVKECMINGVFNVADETAYITQINNYFNTHSVIDLRAFVRFIDTLASPEMFRKAPAMQTSVPAYQPVKQEQKPVQENSVQPPSAAVQAPQQAAMEQTDKKHGFKLFRKEKSAQKKTVEPLPVDAVAIPGVSTINQQPAQPVSVSQPANVQRPIQAVPAPRSAPLAPTSQSALSDDGSGDTIIGVPPSTVTAGVKNAFLTDQNGRRYEIRGNIFWIGRSKVSNIKNNLILTNGGVSKNHAYIEKIDNRYYITDSNSQNGTFLNGKKLSGNVPVELANGSRLRFFTDNFTFYIG